MTNMAHFTNSTGARISGQALYLKVGESKEIGLWGFRDFNGQPLAVEVTAAGSLQCVDIASVYKTKEQGDVRYYRIRGLRAGSGQINAITGGRSSWDNLGLTVSGAAAQPDRLVKALDDGTLLLNKPADAQFIRDAASGAKKVSIHPQIAALLSNMLAFGSVHVMSLLRRGQGQHGVVTGDGVMCKAVDIQGYRGMPVSVKPKELAIQVVCSILERFPAGRFDLGFPRPIGGATGFKPEDDVFFPVPDLETAQRCWNGSIALPLSQMLQPAQDRVRGAMASRAQFVVLYPDGLNHLHVSVTR